MALNNIEITEQLFEAIDAIVKERVRVLPYDKTVIATITNIDNAKFGKYVVTTDTNIEMIAYSENPNYELGDQIYVKIPQNDYTKHKIITDRYIPDNLTEPLSGYIDMKRETLLYSTYLSFQNLATTYTAQEHVLQGIIDLILSNPDINNFNLLPQDFQEQVLKLNLQEKIQNILQIEDKLERYKEINEYKTEVIKALNQINLDIEKLLQSMHISIDDPRFNKYFLTDRINATSEYKMVVASSYVEKE